MALLLKSALPVWVLAVLCAVGIAVWVPPADYLQFLPVALGFVVLFALCVQLATRRADGYILRVSVTTAGAVLILGIATAVLAPVALLAA